MVDFGKFDLLERRGFSNAFISGLSHGGDPAGEIQLRFYGPTSAEMGGVFGARANGYSIGGPTAAVRE